MGLAFFNLRRKKRANDKPKVEPNEVLVKEEEKPKTTKVEKKTVNLNDELDKLI